MGQREKSCLFKLQNCFVIRKHIDIILNDETSLMMAVRENRMDIIDVPVQYGCNINRQNVLGQTALYYC